MKSTTVFIWTGLALSAGPVTAQQEPELSARDAFFTSADMLGPVKKPDPKKAPARADTRAKRTAPPVPAAAVKDPEKHFVTVKNEIRLAALRYSLLKNTPKGDVEVPVDSVFASGDRIRLRVTANQKGYLYLIARGSSGDWAPLFPHPESSVRSNEIVAGRKYEVPGGAGEYFTFDSKAGEERLMILMTPQPVADIDEMILKMANPSGGQQMSAQLDERWTELRGELQSRDLVFTRTKANDPARENAEYVANPTGDKVLVEVPLKHK
jgi:hypothetical protein